MVHVCLESTVHTSTLRVEDIQRWWQNPMASHAISKMVYGGADGNLCGLRDAMLCEGV